MTVFRWYVALSFLDRVLILDIIYTQKKVNMSEIIQNISFENGKLDIVNAQDVSGIKLDCAKQRLQRNQQGRDGLGVLKCQIPELEILKARNVGIDLYDKPTRDKWLKQHPEYLCHVDSGKSGRIIIKGN